MAVSERAAPRGDDGDLVSETGKRLARRIRHERFDRDVVSAERCLRESSRLERLLNIQAEVRDVRDELRVRLRLVPGAHNAEADARVVLLHQRRDDGVQRALPRREHVRVILVERKEAAAVLQRKPAALWHDAAAESGVDALN